MNETQPPDPEQLLKMLDMQIALQRGSRVHKRESSQQKRWLVLGVALVFVAGALVAAFLFLEAMAPEVRSMRRSGTGAGTEAGKPPNKKF